MPLQRSIKRFLESLEIGGNVCTIFLLRRSPENLSFSELLRINGQWLRLPLELD
jgi:hypothetical protein